MHTHPFLQVAKNSRSIGFLLRAVTALDVASARAKHAAWAGAARPTFLTPEEAEKVGIAGTVLLLALHDMLAAMYVWEPFPQKPCCAGCEGCHSRPPCTARLMQ